MQLIINQQAKQFDTENLSVQDLIQLEMPQFQTGIAVAINNKVVSKTNWTSTYCQNGDAILIITASQGG